MNKSLPLQPGMIKLAGISSVCVAIFVLPFPVIDAYMGGLFAPEVFYGRSIEPWIQRVSEHSSLASLGMLLPMIGFSCMLVAGRALYKLIPGNSWQKQLAMMAYLVGVPLAVTAFVTGFSLTTLIGNAGSDAGNLSQVVVLPLNYFMYINFAFGPFFIIVIANVCIGLAAAKAAVLPKWICYWPIINSVLILLGFISIANPVFSFGQAGGPLTMLWFLSTGIYLLFRVNDRKIHDMQDPII